MQLTRYYDVIRARWRLKPPAYPLFIQQRVQANSQGKIKASHHWPTDQIKLMDNLGIQSEVTYYKFSKLIVSIPFDSFVLSTFILIIHYVK